MNRCDLLAREALRGALGLRLKHGKNAVEPICIYDFAQSLGVGVMFVPGSSFEGMYSKSNNTIMVASQRPPGRQVFSCAHELGHWHFRHGLRVDTIQEGACAQGKPEEENLADYFAAFLLMPSQALALAFSARGWKPTSCTPIQVYTIACQFGVGYLTLLNHLRWALNILPHSYFEALKKTSPKKIRNQALAGELDDPGHIAIVDSAWSSIPIDLQVGQVGVLPYGAMVATGDSVEALKSTPSGTLFLAARPGIAMVTTPEDSWAAFIRVSRKEFVGRNEYRHLEEAGDDN